MSPFWLVWESVGWDGFRKLQGPDLYHAKTIKYWKCHTGRTLISMCFKEYPWPLNADQVTPCAFPPP